MLSIRFSTSPSSAKMEHAARESTWNNAVRKDIPVRSDVSSVSPRYCNVACPKVFVMILVAASGSFPFEARAP